MPNTFPYSAVNPMTAKDKTFNNIDDVYKVLIECYDKCVAKGYDRLGEALHQQALFIVNEELILDQDIQLTIKKHQYCKQFNCPPYPSMIETPANVIDDFMVIEQEMTQFGNKEKNG